MGGDGAETNRYIICSREQLKAIEGDPTKHYALLGNINLQDMPFEPIDGEFIGSLDGRGFRIQNLRIEENHRRVALFRTLGEDVSGGDSGYIRNLGIEGIYVENRRNGGSDTDLSLTAALVAYLARGQLGSVYVIDNDPDIDIQGPPGGAVSDTRYDTTGGLVGQNSNAIPRNLILASYTQIDIHGGRARNSRVGGLVGYFNTGKIIASYSRSNVTGGDGANAYVGGIAGELDYGIIAGIYALGNVSVGGSASGIGGIAGFSRGAKYLACYAFVNLTGPGRRGLFHGNRAGGQFNTSFGIPGPDTDSVAPTQMDGVISGAVIDHPLLLYPSYPGTPATPDFGWGNAGTPWQYPEDANLITTLNVMPPLVPPSEADVDWNFVPILRYTTTGAPAGGGTFEFSCDPALAAQLLPTGACGTEIIPGQDPRAPLP